jgi:hypothetical protein
MVRVLVVWALSCCAPVWCAQAVTLGEAEQHAVLEAVHRSVPDAGQHGGHETVTGLRHDDGRITATVEFKPTTIGRRSRWKMVFCRRADEPEMWTCGGKCGKFYYAESISIPGQAEPVDVSTGMDAAFVDAALAFARVRALEGQEGLAPRMLSRIASVNRTPIGTHAEVVTEDDAGKTAIIYLTVAPRLSDAELEPELALIQPGARFHFQLAYHEVPRGADGKSLLESHAASLPSDAYLLPRSETGYYALRKLRGREPGQAVGAFVEHYRLAPDGSVLERAVSEVAEDYDNQSMMQLHLGETSLEWSGDRWLYAPHYAGNLVIAYTQDTPKGGFSLDDPSLAWYYIFNGWDRFLALGGGEYDLRLSAVQFIAD